MSFLSRRRFSRLARRWGGFSLALLIAGTVSGCGFFHGSADVGSDLKPHLGTSVTFPLGK